MSEKTVCIIGAGLGGLFTGAMLAKEGFRVTMVEKNATIGGGLQTFHRFGEAFDTGMHVIGGMQPGGNVFRICKYLGVMDKAKIRMLDPECSDLLYFSDEKKYYRIAQGRENFVKTLSEDFPKETENLQNYVEAIFRITNEADLFHLRPSDSYIVTHSDEFIMAADAFIAKYIKDEKLRAVLAYMNPLYGGQANQTPAYVHAIVNVLYIEGAARFVGGSEQFAQLLADVITENGGEIRVNEPCTHVEVVDREVQYVETKKGNRFTADYYISAIHPCALLNIVSERAFPKSYRTRLDEIPNSYSAFSLYIKLKKNTFPYINHSEYYMSKHEYLWDFGRTDRPWPLGFLMMTSPEENQSEYSTKVLVTAPMSYERVRQWENSTVGHRPEEYKRWKEECAELLLNQVEELHPGFREKIEAINTSSPLTIRDFYNAKEGTMCGYSKNYANLTLSQLPVVTKVRNLLLTGQNNNLHGFCGVPLTAINTAEAILGRNYILNKINSLEK